MGVARLASHLLRIAAAAASSRASPAPGMQRLRQAGRCLGRAVSPHQASSSDGLARGRDSGGGSSCFELELGSPWPPIFLLATSLWRRPASVAHNRDVFAITAWQQAAPAVWI